MRSMVKEHLNLIDSLIVFATTTACTNRCFMIMGIKIRCYQQDVTDMEG